MIIYGKQRQKNQWKSPLKCVGGISFGPIFAKLSQVPSSAQLSIALYSIHLATRPTQPKPDYPTGLASFCTSRLLRKLQFCIEALSNQTC